MRGSTQCKAFIVIVPSIRITEPLAHNIVVIDYNHRFYVGLFSIAVID